MVRVAEQDEKRSGLDNRPSARFPFNRHYLSHCIHLTVPGIPKCLPRACQTRHDSANRQGRDCRNLMIGELFDFTQDQYFTERARHRIENEA